MLPLYICRPLIHWSYNVSVLQPLLTHLIVAAKLDMSFARLLFVLGQAFRARLKVLLQDVRAPLLSFPVKLGVKVYAEGAARASDSLVILVLVIEDAGIYPEHTHVNVKLNLVLLLGLEGLLPVGILDCFKLKNVFPTGVHCKDAIGTSSDGQPRVLCLRFLLESFNSAMPYGRHSLEVTLNAFVAVTSVVENPLNEGWLISRTLRSAEKVKNDLPLAVIKVRQEPRARVKYPLRALRVRLVLFVKKVGVDKRLKVKEGCLSCRRWWLPEL